MRFLYGTYLENIDVTSRVDECFNNEGNINIPSGDAVRAVFFTDPLPGVLKVVIAIDSNNVKKIFTDLETVSLNENDTFVEEESPKDKYLKEPYIENNEQRLQKIQSLLKLDYGSFKEEYPEQLMSVSYIKKDAKVLEIGSNIGRNSLVIGMILEDEKNFVTVECDEKSYKILCSNRDMNKLNFHCENSALSLKKLIQRGWTTIPSNVVLHGFQPVNTVTYKQLIDKYNIVFDTLVLDCEGAFYHILKDMPEILTNIKLIIIENDFTNTSHKNYVDQSLISNNFTRIYNSGTVNIFPAYINNFYEVWQKITQ